jgi:hypothetical protein
MRADQLSSDVVVHFDTEFAFGTPCFDSADEKLIWRSTPRAGTLHAMACRRLTTQMAEMVVVGLV